jgi:membrane protease YdiL (CAAX protease family)
MSTSQKLYIGLGVIVIAFYLGLTYLPQITGTCLDGECGFSTGEIAISVAFPLAFFMMPVVLEMVIYKKNLRQSLNDIGVTRFRWTGIRLATIAVLPLIVFNPLYAWATNTPLQIKPSWVWFILSAVLVNGLAEETMMRGYVFRHLREGRGFWRAATLSTIYFALYHFPLILTAGPVIGIAGVIMSIPIGFLTAYVYERGENTIWGPVLLHAVTNGLAYSFVFAPETQAIASSLYLVTGMVTSTIMLVWAYRASYGREATRILQPAVSNA